jgi:hypothetical protein
MRCLHHQRSSRQGVIAMWAVFATALLAVRRRLRLRLWAWRIPPTALGAVIAVGTVVHAVLIDGTMVISSRAKRACCRRDCEGHS